MLSIYSYGSYSGQQEGQASPLPNFLLFFESFQHLKSTKCFLFYRALPRGIMALLEGRPTVALDSKVELKVQWDLTVNSSFFLLVWLLTCISVVIYQL